MSTNNTNKKCLYKAKKHSFKHPKDYQAMSFNHPNKVLTSNALTDNKSALLRYLIESNEGDNPSSYLTLFMAHNQKLDSNPLSYQKDKTLKNQPYCLEHAPLPQIKDSSLNLELRGSTMAVTDLTHTVKHYILFALSLLTCIFVMYQSISAAMADEALDDLLSLSYSEFQLSDEDKKVLAALNKANNPKSAKNKVSAPQVADATNVRFVYGASRPNLVCSLLHVCDIALEPNETVVDLKVGDSTRWIIERSASGSDQGMIEHIAVKPTDVGLNSNLRIYTDKRTYYIDLSSSDKDFMPQISFIYPEQALKNFALIKSNLVNSLKSRTIATNDNSSPVLIDNLDFSYQYSGDESLYPIRTFNDGKKTYLQMPHKIMSTNVPALVVVHSTNVFSDDHIAVTNYRIKDDKFIVDGLPERIRLFLGASNNGIGKSADIIYKS